MCPSSAGRAFGETAEVVGVAPHVPKARAASSGKETSGSPPCSGCRCRPRHARHPSSLPDRLSFDVGELGKAVRDARGVGHVLRCQITSKPSLLHRRPPAPAPSHSGRDWHPQNVDRIAVTPGGGKRGVEAVNVATVERRRSPPAATRASVASTAGPPAFSQSSDAVPAGRGCFPTPRPGGRRRRFRHRSTPLRRNAASSTSPNRSGPPCARRRRGWLPHCARP